MKRCPTGKVRHNTVGAAHAHRRRMKNSLLDVYLCSECHAWHIGRSRDPARCAKRISEVLDRYNASLARRLGRPA